MASNYESSVEYDSTSDTESNESASRVSVTSNSPTPIKMDIKHALCTWINCTSSPKKKLGQYFRKYQMILRFFWWWCNYKIKEMLKIEDKTVNSISVIKKMKSIPVITDNDYKILEKLVKEIDDRINKIAGAIEGSQIIGKNEISIEWVKKDENTLNLPSRIEAVILAKPIPDSTFIIPQKSRDSVGIDAKYVKYGLEQLENHIESITKEHLKITNCDIEAMGIIGWSVGLAGDLKDKPSVEASCLDGRAIKEVCNGIYKRDKVPLEELECDRPRKGITRLRLYYEARSGKIVKGLGTGWLADSNTVVTAGHCAMNQEYGRLVAVEIFVAYETDKRQVRDGTHVAVHHTWYTSFSEEHDLAYIRFSNAFHDTKPMSLADIPKDKILEISVAGYSKDLEGGERMHFAKCKIKLTTTTSHNMIEYKLDTEQGTSGSPICYGDGVIGVHTGAKPVKDHDGNVTNHGVAIYQASDNVQRFCSLLIEMTKMSNFGQIVIWRMVIWGDKKKKREGSFRLSTRHNKKTKTADSSKHIVDWIE